MTEAVAWIVFPLVFHLVATGIGLLAERAARIEVPDALLAPTGACLAIPVAVVVLELGGAGAAMGGALVALALAGAALTRDRRLARLAPGWPAVAGLLVFLLYMGPVVLAGHWTWLGYNFVNDTGANLAVTEHLAEHGKALEAGIPSTRLAVVNGAIAQGYPLGAHGLLAALEWLVPAPVEAVYQPFIASLAAFAGMALAWLARSVGVRAGAAVAIALVAVGANLTYQYAMQGSFKELALVCIVCTAGALSRFALDARLPVGSIALVGATLAAAVAVFTAGAAGYAAGLGAIALVAIAIERPPQRLAALGRVIVAPVALLVVIGPILVDAVDFANTGAQVFANTNADLSKPLSSPAVLGQLARPLPFYQSLGTWLREDYRFPTAPGLGEVLTTTILVLAGALIVLVVVVELRKRRLGAMLVLVPPLLLYLVAEPRLEPYADAKLLVVMSPMVVFAAGVGAWWVYRRVPAAGIVVAVALAGGVIVSDAFAYRNAHIVPVQRMDALRDAAEHAGARHAGQWLFPEWEEYAKHFGKAAPINVASESFSPRSVALRRAQVIFNHSFDLDDMTLDYVESWPGIMLRRSPEASRPPANYELVYRNAYYELWQRRSDGPQVLEHLPLQRSGQAAIAPTCQDVRDLAARVHPGERIIAARREMLPTLGVTVPPIFGATRPERRRWVVSPEAPGTVITNGHGVISGHLTVPAGTYEAWVKGGGGRPLIVSVDGREVGSQRQINTPGQWLPMGRVTLDAGRHEVELRRPGAGLEPGNGVNGPIGGIALERITPRPIVTVTPEDAEARLCSHPWDWIERVSG
jgi:hypothetical protein